MTNKRGNLGINVILRRVSITIETVEEKLSTTYSECVSVALVIQHAKRMRSITLSCDMSGSTIIFHIIS
jgi:hypothetical protein